MRLVEEEYSLAVKQFGLLLERDAQFLQARRRQGLALEGDTALALAG